MTIKTEIKEVLVNSFKPKILINLLQAGIATTVISAVVALIDGHAITQEGIKNFLLLLAIVFVGIFILYLAWVLIKLVGVFDSHFEVTDKSYAVFGWLTKAFFGLITLGVTLYALYFVLGGVAGLLKFGLKNL